MLHVHRAERADRLADGLAETLLEPLEDPFAPEVVAVPTRGIERWLTQRLSTRLGTTGDRHDGVCANVEFPFPGRLIQAALAAASGIDPENDPWVAERSVWRLLELVDECLDEPWLATLARHLEGARGDPEDPMRRFGAVRHIADLFDRYGVHRPDMVRAWAAGSFGRARRRRCLAARAVAAAAGADRRAESGRAARAGVRADPERCGVARPPGAAVAVRADANPPLLPRRAGRDRGPARPAPVRAPPIAGAMGRPWPRSSEAVRRSRTGARTRPPTAPVNRLLASWGRDVRELQLVLASAGEAADHHHALPGGGARHAARDGSRVDIREDRPPPGPALSGEPDPRPATPRRRSNRPDPRLPRPRAPGRGAARRGPPSARGRPDARAARRDRDVPGHRDVRAADPGHVRLGPARGRRRG